MKLIVKFTDANNTPPITIYVKYQFNMTRFCFMFPNAVTMLGTCLVPRYMILLDFCKIDGKLRPPLRSSSIPESRIGKWRVSAPAQLHPCFWEKNLDSLSRIVAGLKQYSLSMSKIEGVESETCKPLI